MAITSAYLVAVGKLGDLLKAVRNAQAPSRFTNKFLEDLGFKSTNDRLFIGLLKAIGFLDQGGVPQQRYYDYLDESQSARVLADGIQDAYEDLFRVNKSAHKMSQETVKNKLRSLTQDQHSDVVLKNMARTFVELVKHADFTASSSAASENREPESNSEPEAKRPESEPPAAGAPVGPKAGRVVDALAYRIEITLPPTRDKAVYDAIFRSLKEHLL